MFDVKLAELHEFGKHDFISLLRIKRRGNLNSHMTVDPRDNCYYMKTSTTAEQIRVHPRHSMFCMHIALCSSIEEANLLDST
jgi:hypothetical protein